MNWRAMRAIVQKDISVVVRSRGVFLPLIIVPTVLMIFIPLVLTVSLGSMGTDIAQFDRMLQSMPQNLLRTLEGFDERAKIIVLTLVYVMAPMYLVVPLMVASVIAADSFAGEKERKTLEALLYTPTTDRELFWAKLGSAWIPAIAVAWGSSLLYGLVANIAAWPLVGRLLFPNWMWLILAIFVAPAVAGIGLGTSVIVSARVSTFQEAYQLGGAVVLPIVLLIVAQVTGLMYLDSRMVLLLGMVFWIVCAVLIRHGSSLFTRSRLLARL
ncbi:MAG: ABC transporter permease subunit [Bacillota bacterium]